MFVRKYEVTVRCELQEYEEDYETHHGYASVTLDPVLVDLVDGKKLLQALMTEAQSDAMKN